MRDIFNYIKASKFFPKYAKKVKNYRDKITGYNRHGTEIGFTKEDEKEILAGLKQLFADLKKK